VKKRYFEAWWPNSDCIEGCEHKHKTVTSAVPCIHGAGGWVVAYEGGRLCPMSEAERAEFRRAYCNEKPSEENPKKFNALCLAPA
jgi:hypothetical protein